MMHLAKVYIEPTNYCNLNCRTCMRNAWDEPLGYMPLAVFRQVLAGVRESGDQGGTIGGVIDRVTAPGGILSPSAPLPSLAPTFFFGGIGEPLAHADILTMVAEAKALGGNVELITNGTLLTEEMSRRLIGAGLDRLWVSLDGARAESYADVRLGGALPEVLANMLRFRGLRPPAHRPLPQIGIAFVAMKRNIADLPALLRIGNKLGATRFMVTNLLPHTAEMCDEILYAHAMSDISYLASPWVPHISLPRLDIGDRTAGVLYDVLRSHRNVTFAGNNLGSASDRCPFIEDGAAAVGWDGSFSPCLPLLHDHLSYLEGRPRHSRRFVVGNVAERSLSELWHAPQHLAFREKVAHFSFSPCAYCGGCERSLSNEEDCFGNAFPTCGGCLWAQGIIQCP